MIKKISLGKYTPGNSFFHKLDARSKISISFVITIMVFYLRTLVPLTIVFLLSLMLIKFSGFSLKKFIKSNLFILFFSALSAFLNLFFEAESNFVLKGSFFVSIKTLQTSILTFLRLSSLIFITSSIMATTSPNEISSAIEKILKPLGFLGINSRDIALTITITLRFIPIVFDEAKKVLKAQQVRGVIIKNKNIIKILKNINSFLIPLFVGTLKRADDLAIALESRCYNSFGERTEFKTFKLKKQDYITFLFLALFILGAVLCQKILKI